MKKKETYENSYLFIEAAKSFFNVPREKLSPRCLAAEVTISRLEKSKRQSYMETHLYLILK
jgi:hypothetical protein